MPQSSESTEPNLTVEEAFLKALGALLDIVAGQPFGSRRVPWAEQLYRALIVLRVSPTDPA